MMILLLNWLSDLKIFLGHGFEDDVIPYKVHIESLKPIENFTGLNKSYIPKHAHGIHPQEIKDVQDAVDEFLAMSDEEVEALREGEDGVDESEL